MSRFVAALLKNEERSKTILAIAAAVAGVAAIAVGIAAYFLR
jgi:hypothetical protein